MLKKAGLVDDNNNPDMDTLTSYGNALGIRMPALAQASTDERKLRILVRNAGRIRDAVVGLAKTCSPSADTCTALANVLEGLETSLTECGGPDCTLENQVGSF